MTIKETLEYGINTLNKAGIDEAKVDAMLLLEYIFEINRAKYLMCQTEEACNEKILLYKEVIEKRSLRIPLQYITGTQDFMGYTFKVNENVLIPRYDTEVVVYEAVKSLKGIENPKILDVCTGSGCIAISLAKLIDKATVKALDISTEALSVARENNETLDGGVEFVESDLFDNIDSEYKYDLIISNPPYIRTEVINELMTEVKSHEPLLALDGDEDGLKFYRKISEKAPEYLNKGAMLVYEIGHDQAEDVTYILSQNGFHDIVVKKDLAGLDRVVLARWL